MRRRLPFSRLVLVLSLALAATTAVGLWVVRFDRVVVAPGYLAGGSTSVRAPRAGRVAAVDVRPAQSIVPGHALVRLETDRLEAEAEQLRLRIDSLDQRLRALRTEHDRLIHEVHPTEREQAAHAAERARLELARAEVKARAIATLGEDGLAGRLDVEEAELARQLAAMALEDAERSIPLLETEQRSRLSQIMTEIQSTEGQIAEERTRRAELLRLIAVSTVTAERAGVVIGSDLDELSGQHVEEGDELLRLAVAPAVRFEGTLSDSGRALAKPGLRAKIRLEGYPWLVHGTLSGRVERLSGLPDTMSGFPVTLSFDAATAPGPLYEGMRGKARIVIEERVTLGRLLIERITGSGQP